MKQLEHLSLFALLILSASLYAQETADAETYEHFVVLYTTGESWDTTKQAWEQDWFNDHSAHLSSLRKSKTISVGGRYAEYGMLIIRAKDEEDAQSLILNDVAIEHRLFDVEIFPANFFYMGCVE